jgi:hypothetical protein
MAFLAQLLKKDVSEVVPSCSEVILDDTEVILRDAEVILSCTEVVLRDAEVILRDTEVVLRDTVFSVNNFYPGRDSGCKRSDIGSFMGSVVEFV